MNETITNRIDNGKVIIGRFATSWNRIGIINILTTLILPVIFLLVMNIFFYVIFPEIGQTDAPNEVGLGVMLFFLTIEVFLLGFFMTNLFNLGLNTLAYFKIIDPIKLSNDSYIGQNKGIDIKIIEPQTHSVLCEIKNGTLKLTDKNTDKHALAKISLANDFKVIVKDDKELICYQKGGKYFTIKFDKKVTAYYHNKLDVVHKNNKAVTKKTDVNNV